MDQESPFFNSGEMDLIEPSLLKAVFDKIPASIEVLKAVREGDRVIDFEYILENESAEINAGHHNRPGKKFLTADINNDGHFQKMVEVVETGKEFRTVIDAKLNGGTEWFEKKYIKFGDGLIVFHLNASKKNSSEIPTRDDAHFIKQIVDTSPEIISIMDLDSLQVIYTNRKIATDLGYTKEQTERMKNPLMDIMFKEDIVPFKKHLEEIKALTSDDKVLEFEYRLVNANGGITWLCDRNAVFKRNSRKRPVEKIGFSQNITDRKEQEEKLLTGDDILQQAEQITGMGTWEYDMVTDNFKWSQGMYQLFNLPMKIKPHPEIYFEYTPEEQKDIVDRIVNNIRSNGEPFEETITLLPENMDKKFVRIKGSPIKDKKNHIVKMVGVDLDITEHLNSAQEVAHLNRKLQERQKELETLNSELKTFNNITSSDYKDTLQFLYTNLEYIATTEARRLGDSAKANIRRAQAAIQRMKLLTSDITGYLQLYEIGVNKTLIDPNPILKDVITGMNKKVLDANASIELTALPYLHADPFLFSLLLKHLLDNAIKFKRVVPATIIKIKYSRADEINNIPGALADTPYTLISISDSGVGFPEDNTERVFELFFSIHGKQYPGSGIGLAICKKIMSMHQGLISAESTAGVGTTFICYFPEEVNM